MDDGCQREWERKQKQNPKFVNADKEESDSEKQYLVM